MGQLRSVEGKTLTHRQSEFVSAMISGATVSQSAKLAGYAEPYASTGYRAIQNPIVQQAIREGIEREILQLAPLATKRLKKILGNDVEWEKTPASLKAVAMKQALDLVDAGNSFQRPKDLENEPLGDLSPDEKRELAEMLRKKIAGEPGDDAVVIDAEPIENEPNAQQDAQPGAIDFET